MVIAVPIFALLFLGIERASEKRLKKKGLSTDVDAYDDEKEDKNE